MKPRLGVDARVVVWSGGQPDPNFGRRKLEYDAVGGLLRGRPAETITVRIDRHALNRHKTDVESLANIVDPRARDRPLALMGDHPHDVGGKDAVGQGRNGRQTGGKPHREQRRDDELYAASCG